MKCPKCNKTKLRLMEFGVIRGPIGILEKGEFKASGDDPLIYADESYHPTHVEAVCCGCGYQWVCKKIHQIPLDGEKL